MSDNKAASLYVLIWLMYIIVYPQFSFTSSAQIPKVKEPRIAQLTKPSGVGEKSSP